MMPVAAIVLALAVATVVAACASATADVSPAPTLRYVALGDSYTIGTSVTEAERFPDQLVAAIGADAARPALELVANLGVNGYTTADLIRDELPALDALEPDLVTLLIGVNDAVQRVPVETYEANVARILDDLLTRLPPDRIVTIAIPDYTVTPAGGAYGDPGQQHDAIVAHNGIIARLASARGIAFVDVFDLSLEATTDRTLVAGDGLHPSGVQYGRWVERIAPVVRDLLAP